MSGTLAKIHIGCKALGIDAAARHDLQLRLVGKASLTDMSETERLRILQHLIEQGFKPVAKGRSKRPAAPRGDLRYVHVLWGLLGQAGELEKPGRAGLNAFVRSQFEGKWRSVPIDIDALRDAGQISDVIRALKAWCKRAGIETERSS